MSSNTRHIYVDMGVVLQGPHPYAVKGWARFTVSGPRNRVQGMALRYILYDQHRRKKVVALANGLDVAKGWPDAVSAYAHINLI